MSTHVDVKLTAEDLALVDAARGEATRSALVRRALREYFAARGNEYDFADPPIGRPREQIA